MIEFETLNHCKSNIFPHTFLSGLLKAERHLPSPPLFSAFLLSLDVCGQLEEVCLWLPEAKPGAGCLTTSPKLPPRSAVWPQAFSSAAPALLDVLHWLFLPCYVRLSLGTCTVVRCFSTSICLLSQSLSTEKTPLCSVLSELSG